MPLEPGGPGVVEPAGPTTVAPAMSPRGALDVSIPSSTPRLPAPPPARQVMRVAPTGNLHVPALDRRDDPPGHDPRQPARRTRTRTAAPRRTLGAPGGLVVPGATDRPSTPPAPRHSSCAGVSLSLVACAGRSGTHRGGGEPPVTQLTGSVTHPMGLVTHPMSPVPMTYGSCTWPMGRCPTMAGVTAGTNSV